MESTVVNSCKEMYSFSDFPPPSHWPNFTHHSLVDKYLRMYADHFGLWKYIQFNTAVLKVLYANLIKLVHTSIIPVVNMYIYIYSFFTCTKFTQNT